MNATKGLSVADDRGVLPMIISETGADDEPEIERIICVAISGGADYLNDMPRELILERMTPHESIFARYVQTDQDTRFGHQPTPQPVAASQPVTLATVGKDFYHSSPIAHAAVLAAISEAELIRHLLENERRLTELATDALRRAAPKALMALPKQERPSDEDLLRLMPEQWTAPVYAAAAIQAGALSYARVVWDAAAAAHQPAPPAEGEAGDLIALLAVGSDCRCGVKLSPEQCRRVAALLEQRHPAPVPVSVEREGAND